jgi:hypothetical protein
MKSIAYDYIQALMLKGMELIRLAIESSIFDTI